MLQVGGVPTYRVIIAEVAPKQQTNGIFFPIDVGGWGNANYFEKGNEK
jgi:hypothetical protein